MSQANGNSTTKKPRKRAAAFNRSPAVKKSAKRKAKTPAGNPDKTLILNCCRVSAGLHGFAGAFQVEVDGNSEHAAEIGGQYWDLARRALKLVSKTGAKTIGGVLAKAKLLPIVMADDSADGVLSPVDKVRNDWRLSIEDTSAAFYLSFAADVRRVLENMTPQCELSSDTPELFHLLTMGRQAVLNSRVDAGGHRDDPVPSVDPRRPIAGTAG